LLTKLQLAKKILTSFPCHMLENIWIKFAFPYAILPHHKGAKWNTIGVTRGANAKLPHCTSLMLTYLMENEMPFVHHTIKWWGCNYTNKDNKGLSERT
jgi:hypothetical protein